MHAYERLEPENAQSIVGTIRTERHLPNDESVFLAAFRNYDMWSDGTEGSQAYTQYCESGNRELPTVVMDFFMLTTGLAFR